MDKNWLWESVCKNSSLALLHTEPLDGWERLSRKSLDKNPCTITQEAQ